jgi:hypothetical protein
MLRENCDALARAMFERMKIETDNSKMHYALHIMDDMLKSMSDMRFYIGADLAKVYDLYANVEHHPMTERFYRQNAIRIMYRLIHLYMVGKPQYEDDLRDLVFNLGIEEE